jgi:hypothetical protein
MAKSLFGARTVAAAFVLSSSLAVMVSSHHATAQSVTKDDAQSRPDAQKRDKESGDQQMVPQGRQATDSQISTTGKQLVGKSVHDANDRRVGEVVFADVDQTGTTNAIVVQHLDQTGMQSHRVRVPISAISLDGDKVKTTTDLTKAPRDG